MRISDWSSDVCSSDLVTQTLLPLRMLGELVNHVAERDGAGVVRGHQHEDHLIDDIVVGELFAVFGACVAQAREQIVALRCALGRQFAAEKILKHATALQSRAPARERQAEADHAGGGANGGEECLVQRIRLGARLAAHEYRSEEHTSELQSLMRTSSA